MARPGQDKLHKGRRWVAGRSKASSSPLSADISQESRPAACRCTEGVATTGGQRSVWPEGKVEAGYGGTRAQSSYELGGGNV